VSTCHAAGLQQRPTSPYIQRQAPIVAARLGRMWRHSQRRRSRLLAFVLECRVTDRWIEDFMSFSAGRSPLIIFLIVATIAAAGDTLKTRIQATPLHIGLGMSKSAVHKCLGLPRQWLASTGYITDPIEYAASLKVYGIENVNDVYFRRSKTNRYELNIGYSLDDSQSRLNPIPRVWQIIIEADHKAPLIQVLTDSAEAIDICREGCTVNAQGYGNDPGGATDLLPLTSPDRLLNTMRRLSAYQRDKVYNAVVRANWDKGSTKAGRWSEQPVITLQVKMADELTFPRDNKLPSLRSVPLPGEVFTEPPVEESIVWRPE